MLPEGSADAAGHLPLRVPVISAMLMCAGPASPLSPWLTVEEMEALKGRALPGGPTGYRRRVGD